MNCSGGDSGQLVPGGEVEDSSPVTERDGLKCGSFQSLLSAEQLDSRHQLVPGA